MKAILPDILKRNSLYYKSCMAVLFVSLVFVLLYTKTESFLFLNQYHSKWLDGIFINITFFGDGIFSLLIALILITAKQYRLAILIIVAYLFSGLLAQLLKNIFALPRPRLCFTNEQYPFFIAGITRSGYSSFPSGHSCSAFAVATSICLFSRNNYGIWIILSLAVLASYSRIYLGQHFLPDVIAGAFIGIISATLLYSPVHILWKMLSRSGKLKTAHWLQNRNATS